MTDGQGESAELAARLRRARLAARISQEELAERTGLSVRAISDLERGRTRRPYPHTMRLLARVLRLPDPPSTEAAGPDPAPVPRLLPPSIRHFVGRAREQRTLRALLDEAATGMVIATISGMAGVGKTALAVHWAHQVADHFPDGQLYVNLRGFDPAGVPLPPAVAVRRFLDALGVPPARGAADPDAQYDLYRSLLANRRVLIVLDNALDPDQVRPLLPGSAGCLVLVTGRGRLTPLIAAEDAHSITLDLLSAGEARTLLTRRLGTHRVDTEPAAASALIDRCARLPLALAIVAARAATHPDRRLVDLAGELADTGAGLHPLSAGDPGTDVRTAFSWSYHALSPPAARLFPLLGLHPGPDIAAPAAASLAGMPPEQIRPALAELTEASLLAEPVPGRYTMHDLLRTYATDLARAGDATATQRLLDHYLHTAHTADRLLAQALDPPCIPPLRPGVSPEHLTDRRQALAWFTAEHAVLMAVVQHALAAGYDAEAGLLAWTLINYLDRGGHWADLAEIGAATVTAGQHLGDLPTWARGERTVGRACAQRGRFDEALVSLGRALDLYREAGDQTGLAHTHYNLAYMYGRRDRPGPALDHARQALDGFRETGHRFGQARALNTIGWLHAQLGDHREALASCEQALTLLQELDDTLGLAGTWDSIGFAHHHLGNPGEAVTCYEHAIDLFRTAGARYYEADTYHHLGDTHHSTGNAVAARDAWYQALVIFEDLGHADSAGIRAKLDGDAAPST